MQSNRITAALSLMLALGPLPLLAETVERKPNFLLVMADDMGWTDIGSFGSEIDTPNLDEIARRGVTFTDHHVSVSCSPTRSMLLSGTDNHLAGLGNMGELLTPNQVGKPGYEGYLNDRVVSLAEVLQIGGYHTYMAGKWHLGHETGTLPGHRRFERSFALLYGGASHFNGMWGLMEVEDPAEYSVNGEKITDLPEDHFSSRSFTDFLIESIRENADGSCSIWCSEIEAMFAPGQSARFAWRPRERQAAEEPFRVLAMGGPYGSGQDVKPGMFGLELANGHHPNDLARYRELIGMVGSGAATNSMLSASTVSVSAVA